MEYPGFHSWQDCVSPCLQSLKWLQLGSGNAACPVIDLSLEVRDSHLSPWSEHLSGQSSLPMVRTSFPGSLSPRLAAPRDLSPIHFVQCCVTDQQRLSIRSYCMEHVRLVNVKSQAHLVAVGLHQGQVFLESSSRVGRRCGVICISEGRDRCFTVSPFPFRLFGGSWGRKEASL